MGRYPMNKSPELSNEFATAEAQKRFDAALRGARLVGPAPVKNMTPKKAKAQQRKEGKPAKASLSSGSSRASVKIERP